MGSLAPVLSKAGDLNDFPARYKPLKFNGKNLRAALTVGYSNGGGWGTLPRNSLNRPDWAPLIKSLLGS